MSVSVAPLSKEEVVPIRIKDVVVETHLGITMKSNQAYHNVIVRDPSIVKYVKNERKEDNYIRDHPIIRHYDENVCWPEHPLNINGKIQGAIAIIRSLDEKVLLVRNRKLWGLPKGARNYRTLIKLKALTDRHYRETGEIIEHTEAQFTNDDAETSVENLCREVREETGIIIDQNNLEPFRYRNHSGSYCAYDGYYYQYPKTSEEFYSDLQQNSTDHENDELLWVTNHTLKELLYDHRQNHRQGVRIFNHVTYGYLEEYVRTRTSL